MKGEPPNTSFNSPFQLQPSVLSVPTEISRPCHVCVFLLSVRVYTQHRPDAGLLAAISPTPYYRPAAQTSSDAFSPWLLSSGLLSRTRLVPPRRPGPAKTNPDVNPAPRPAAKGRRGYGNHGPPRLPLSTSISIWKTYSWGHNPTGWSKTPGSLWKSLGARPPRASSPQLPLTRTTRYLLLSRLHNRTPPRRAWPQAPPLSLTWPPRVPSRHPCHPQATRATPTPKTTAPLCLHLPHLSGILPSAATEDAWVNIRAWTTLIFH